MTICACKKPKSLPDYDENVKIAKEIFFPATFNMIILTCTSVRGSMSVTSFPKELIKLANNDSQKLQETTYVKS